MTATMTTAAWVEVARQERYYSRDLDDVRSYVRAVRHAQGWTRDEGPDGRLLAAVWRDPAVRPSDRECLDSWLAYWQATQERPGRVESPYNADPSDVARAWALRIPADRCPGPGIIDLLPPGWRGGRRRILALMTLGRKAPHLCLRTMRTADLRRLARLPGGSLKYLVDTVDLVDLDGRVNWPFVAAELAALRQEPLELLRAARVPAYRWRDWRNHSTPRRLVETEITRRAGRLVEALDAIALPASSPHRPARRRLRPADMGSMVQ